MKHNLGDQAVRDRAITELQRLLRYWRVKREKLRVASTKRGYDTVIFTAECALQALGADPDAP